MRRSGQVRRNGRDPRVLRCGARRLGLVAGNDHVAVDYRAYAPSRARRKDPAVPAASIFEGRLEICGKGWLEWGEFALDHLADSWPDLPADIADRDADVVGTIMAGRPAGAVPGECARAGALEMVKAGREREPSLGIRLLADLQIVFGDRETMTTNEILVDLIAIKEAPWGDLRGKPLNDRRLANRLRQYGVKSKQIRFGEKGLKGYYRADLIEAWERYLPPYPEVATHPKQAKQVPKNLAKMFRMFCASFSASGG